MTSQNRPQISWNFPGMTHRYDSPERISAFLAASCSFLAISAASLASFASFSAAILAASLSIRSCFWASRVDCLSLILFSRSVTKASSSWRFLTQVSKGVYHDLDQQLWSPVVNGPPWSTRSYMVRFFIHGPWSKLMVQWKVVSKPGLKWSSHILFKSAKSRSRRFFTKSSSIFTKFQSWIDAIIFTTRLHFGPMREKLKNCWSSYRISLVPPAKWIWIIRK